MLVVAGIFIKLETEKGQLVIESEVADVKVRIINDGKPVSDLTIKHGTTATRLRADKYEVIIDGPSNGLTIENDEFTLKNGATIVARIRKADAPNVENSGKIAKHDQPSDEPLYQGKSLSEWLDVMERDRSPEAIGDSLRACDAMISNTNAAVIGERILKVLPQVAGDISVSNTKGFGGPSFDLLGFSLIAKAYPETFYTIWIREFESGDSAWRDRLLRFSSPGIYSTLRGTEGAHDVQVFVDWAKKRLLQPCVAGTDELEQVVKIADTIVSLWPVAVEEQMLEALKRSPNLDLHWWLTPINQSTKMGYYTASNHERARVALKVLQDDAADDVLVAEACMTLASFPRPNPDYAGLSDEFQSDVRSAIEKRLDRFLQESSSEQCRIVNVDQKFEKLLMPSVKFPRISFQPVWTSLGRSSSNPASVICELLDLYVNVRSSNQDSETLRRFAVSISNYIVPKVPYSGNELRLFIARTNVQWQYFDSLSDKPNSPKGKSEAEEMTSAIRGSAFSLNREGWLKLILFQHPAIEPYLPQQEAAPDVAMAANLANFSQPKPALYEGKTLDEWLEMLSRERSPAGLKSAFDACSALVAPDTSDRITQTVLSVVPEMDGERNLKSGQDAQATTLDDAAFNVLRKANPGPAFYTLWVSEFDHGDEKWRERLWRYAQRTTRGEVATLEPFLAWAERRLSKAPAGNTPDDDTIKSADILRDLTYVHSDPVDPVMAERVFTSLKNSRQLGAEWWLSQPLVYRSSSSDRTGDTNLWSPAMKSEITRVAIETIGNAKASRQLIAQACIILANGADLNPEERTIILTSISSRLTAACATLDKLTELVPIADEFTRFSVPEIVQTNPFSTVRIQFSVRSRQSWVCPVQEMLNLVGQLEGATIVQPQLDLIFQEAQETLELINSQRVKQEANRSRNSNTNASRRGASPLIVQLEWPELTDTDGGVIGSSRDAGGPLATTMLWGTHKPTKQDWLKYLILLHPVMKDTVDAALAKLEPAATETPAE